MVKLFPHGDSHSKAVQSLSPLWRNLVTMGFELNIYYVRYVAEKKVSYVDKYTKANRV
jgi:hypothetical protein